MSDTTNSRWDGWFDDKVLKALAWSLIPMVTMFVYLTERYVDIKVTQGDTVRTEELKALSRQMHDEFTSQSNSIHDDIRHAVKDAITSVESRLASDEARMSAIEGRH